MTTISSRARECPACQTPLPEAAHFCNNCGAPTPSDPGTPERTTAAHDLGELAKVRQALSGVYSIERALGAGGMATVYLATDLKHRRKVAVKVMRPELAQTLGADRFLREVEIAAALSHPNILPVYDSGRAGEILYYVMPMVEGESLQEKLAKNRQLPIEEALRIGAEVIEALAYAHERGIIHRDIKPANIMLARGHALVADFGIARAMDAEGSITKTGLAVGTPQYMSPEQAMGAGGVDGRADIYAMGAVLYEMLAGEPPFTGPTAQAIIARSLVDRPRNLSSTRVTVTAALAAVVDRALAKSPADRYQTAEDLGAALQTSSTDPALPIPSSRRPVAPSSPSPVAVWGTFALSAALTLGLFYGLVNRWGLPSWVLALAVVLLAVGAAVLIVTGRVEARRQAGAEISGLLSRFTWKNAMLGGVLALGAWAVLVTALVIKGPGGAATGGAVRLAVLPFENRGAADQAYFVDGVADQVRSKLTGLGAVQVIARASSEQYRRTTKSPQEIGKELGVDYLLGATVAWDKSGGAGGRVRVSPELIDVRTGASKWQQSFDADMTDVFQVQGSIASQVAGALGLALGSTEQKELGERPTGNLAAYDAYLKARAIVANDPAALRRRAAIYEQAVALDSGFVDAWAGLGSTLANLYYNGIPDPAISARALAAVERTRRLAPDGAATHLALGRYYFLVPLDNARAAEEYSRALAIRPNDADILRNSSNTDLALGKWDEALAKAVRVRQLDPRSLSGARALMALQAFLHHYPESLETGNAALALAPDDLNTIETQASTYLMQGDLAGARAVVAAAPPSVSPPDLVTYFGTYNDLFWMLTDEQQKLLVRLTPSAFDGDRGSWAMVLMQTHWVRGDAALTRVYADSARIELEGQLKAAPGNWQREVLLGLAMAHLGRKEDAIRLGMAGTAAVPMEKDFSNGPYAQWVLTRILILVGEKEKAIDHLEALLKVPNLVTPAWIRIDPAFAPLKGNSRFDKLAAGG